MKRIHKRQDWAALTAEIRAWLRGNDAKAWLFGLCMNEAGKIPADSDGDVWSGNNLVVDAYLDRKVLIKAFARAKAIAAAYPKNIESYEGTKEVKEIIDSVRI